MIQAQDYQEEADILASLLDGENDGTFDTPTLFKGWTINDVIGHLYMFDVAALKSLESDEAFLAFYQPLQEGLAAGKSFMDMQQPWLDGLNGRALFETWRSNSLRLGECYGKADPKKRLKWAGPDMSARSSITARQMETWAHGQEIFDALGETRVESERIYNVCHLGVATFGWTYINRNLPVPNPPPFVELTSPSGAVWDWHHENNSDYVKGSAVEFAQVVTQVRNIEDTNLITKGPIAEQWMSIAQCFAGPPMDPPNPGTRFKSKGRVT